VETLLLSGDTKNGSQCRFRAWHFNLQAELTPEGKVRALREWADKRRGSIAMVETG